MDWRPAADLAAIRQRSDLLATVRRFFSDRNILEVETPLLCCSGITDPSIEPFTASCGDGGRSSRFLQTSPEYAMKRMLAAFGEPMFQIARAFRDGELGARHNPEFSLLEWYRPGFDHHQLMAEVAALVGGVLGERPVEKYSYRQLFQQRLALDPFTEPTAELPMATANSPMRWNSASASSATMRCVAHAARVSVPWMNICWRHWSTACRIAAASRWVSIDC